MNALENLEKTYKLVDAPKDVIKAVQGQLFKVHLLDGAVDGVAGKLTLFAFSKFKELEYLEYPDLLGKSTAIALLEATYDRKAPTDEVAKSKDTSLKAFFPKFGWVGANDLIHSGGNFTWEEFTKNLTRVPQNEKVVDAIAKLAYYLEDVRSELGNGSSFTHVDLRGYRARWAYGNA